MDLLLLDWDGTLFDSDGFKKAFTALLGKKGISEASVNSALSSYYQSLKASIDFNPKTFFHLLAQQTHHETNEIYELFWNSPELYTASLYPDTIPFLQYAKKHSVALGLFSEGIINFQKHKIHMSGVASYFDPHHWYIFRKKTEKEALTTVPHVPIIDNKASIVERLRQSGFDAHHLDRTSMDLMQFAPLL